MNVAVVKFPGSNCDEDAAWAFRDVVGTKVTLVSHASADLPTVDAVVLPGGFSYGDYLRSGAMAARTPVMAAVQRFAARGGPVLGICNGFQVLTEAGMLDGALARNAGLDFVCKDVYVRTEVDGPPFLSLVPRGSVMKMGIAHHEGRFVAPPSVLERLEGEGRVAFRYVDESGRRSDAANPNGSAHDVAGIVDAKGNVLGMMPHPERAVDPLLGNADALPFLRSLLDAFVGRVAEGRA